MLSVMSETMPPERIPKPAAKGPIRRRDKYLLIGLAIAIVTFALISVAINALRPDVPTTSNAAGADPRVQDSTYVLLMDEKLLPGRTQAQAIALGKLVCAQLNAGGSKDDAATALRGEGLNAIQSGAVMTAAVKAFCPAHRSALDQ
jgi:hypothetical protein